MSDLQNILSTYHLASCQKEPCTCRMDEVIDEVAQLELSEAASEAALGINSDLMDGLEAEIKELKEWLGEDKLAEMSVAQHARAQSDDAD